MGYKGQLLGLELNGSRNGCDDGTLQHPEFVEVHGMPQQMNSHDCGVYVLAVTAALCGCIADEAAAAGGALAGAAALLPAREPGVLAVVTPQAVHNLRRRIIHAIRLLEEVSTAAKPH